MFKKIPGSTCYRINLNGDFVDLQGNPQALPEINNVFVSIRLFDEIRVVEKTRLALLAWYEVGDVVGIRKNLDNFVFNPISDALKVRCGRIPTFKEPMQYAPGFRYIPAYCRYAININRDIIDTKHNTLVDKLIDDDGYEVAVIYSPDINQNRRIRVHRLLALAWLPNNDFLNRPFINHLDGVKNNNRLENLAWCSTSENVRHALDTGLNPCYIKMKSRDRKTGEVVNYKSVSEMALKLNMPNVTASNYTSKLPGYLYNRRYEIKLFEDDTPWFYENTDEENWDCEPAKAIYTITVLDKTTGLQKRFISTKHFRCFYKVNASSDRIDLLVDVFKTKYPNCDISYIRNAVIGPYQVIDIIEKKTFIFDSIWRAANFIGRTRTEIQYDLSRNRKFIYCKKWIIVAGINDYFVEDYTPKPANFNEIQILFDDNRPSITCASMKNAGRLLGLDYKTIRRYVNSQKSFKGMLFRALEP